MVNISFFYYTHILISRSLQLISSSVHSVVCWLFRQSAYEELKSLQSDSWIDGDTRAVVVELTLFHTQSTLFSSVKLALEIPPHGRVTTSLQVASLFLYKYTSTMDYVILVSEVCVCMCHLVYNFLHLYLC